MLFSNQLYAFQQKFKLFYIAKVVLFMYF